MAEAQRWRRFWKAALLVSPLFVIGPLPSQTHAAASLERLYSQCAAVPASTDSTVQAGHPYLSTAFDALSRDRQRFAGLGALKRSAVLSAVAEAHSAYMASIGSWSDGDPDGYILSRVRATGIDATYAGQNVVTASGGTVSQAIQNGEAFFAREAGTGGPHWANITNSNHAFVGMGIALLGGPGNYTLYLTQVFADVGDCGSAADTTYTPAASVSGAPKVGSIVHAGTDYLSLRSEPGGMLIQTLRANQRLKVIDVQDNWAQVQVLTNQVFGWVFVPLLGQ